MLVIPSIAGDPQLMRFKARVARGKEVVHVGGLWGSSAPMVTAYAASACERTFLYITAHLEEADDVRDDMELFLGRPCELLPAWEALPGEGAGSTEIQAERLRLCAHLVSRGLEPVRPRHDGSVSQKSDRSARAESRSSQGNPPAQVIVAPIQALMQPVPAPDALLRNTLRLVVGGASEGGTEMSPDALTAWAVDRDFARLELVESPGDIARRGDIVDLFAPGEAAPYRIQFDGDAIESIRRFDVSTQRST
ncbi:MAG: hypothetical protein Q7R41_18650, partial [Phycisphaerales bacterium]|nr:hypothetical protein [Phycisphaerales bacterium]